jgi:phage FluMu protein Com
VNERKCDHCGGLLYRAKTWWFHYINDSTDCPKVLARVCSRTTREQEASR